jgi:hypothetical protein
MRGFSRAAVCGVILAFAGRGAYGEGEATVQTPPSLAGVAWAGPAPDPAFLDGKTVVVLTYVTWCPKCNAWTGKVASEVKEQSVDKPVVVLAISTDTPPAGALEYMKQRNLVGRRFSGALCIDTRRPSRQGDRGLLLAREDAQGRTQRQTSI